MTAPARGRRLGPDARREEILAGATALFSDRSYAAVSTGEIADAAGVARGLINHYFGTKRALYLEVVRRLVTIPDVAVDTLPSGTTGERAGAAVDWFLDAVLRHRGLWLAVAAGTASADPEVDAILAEADDIAADQVAAALAGPDVAPAVLRPRIRSFFGLVRAAAREWLVRGSMDRAEVHDLLVTVLVTVLPPDGAASSQV